MKKIVNVHLHVVQSSSVGVVYRQCSPIAETRLQTSLTHHTPPIIKRKEGSGDLAYSMLFARNAIIAKNLMDDRKYCMAGYVRTPQVRRY